MKLAGNIVFTIYVETSTWNWFLTYIGSYKIRKLVSLYYLQFQAFANMHSVFGFFYIHQPLENFQITSLKDLRNQLNVQINLSFPIIFKIK